MILKTCLVLLVMFLLLSNKTYFVKAQVLGGIFSEPLNNLIKVFDGSYGTPSDTNRNRNNDNSLSYQSRFGTNNRFDQSGGNCAGIWSYANDGGHIIGLVTIQNPDRIKNVLKLTLSLSAALPSVIHILKNAKVDIN